MTYIIALAGLVLMSFACLVYERAKRQAKDLNIYLFGLPFISGGMLIMLCADIAKALS